MFLACFIAFGGSLFAATQWSHSFPDGPLNYPYDYLYVTSNVDIDGDGIGDVMFNDPWDSSSNNNIKTYYSGQDGQTVKWTITVSRPTPTWSVALPKNTEMTAGNLSGITDVDGDGAKDVVVVVSTFTNVITNGWSHDEGQYYVRLYDATTKIMKWEQGPFSSVSCPV